MAPRRTQEQRRAETRARLLDAALDCLVDVGASATTTLEVARRAGLSRGAQQHHFPTKAALMVAIARHVTEGFHADLRAAAADLPSGPGRAAAAIDVMWRAYSGRRGVAHIELWVAGRTDPDVHDALHDVERAMAPQTRALLRGLFGGSERPDDRLDVFVDTTAQLMRGLVLRSMLSGGSRWIRRDLEAWKQLAETR
jgi:AcrR family transcriptional regulator